MGQKMTRKSLLLSLLLTVIVLIFPVTNSKSQVFATSANRDLVGTWELVAWKHRQADGTTKYPMGETPVGLLIYDRLGNVSIQIMDDFRPTFESGYDQTTLEELKSVYKTYAAMFGRYTVDTSTKTIGIQVRAITNPNYLSAELTRYYKLKGDLLTLSLDKKRMNNTVWKRVKSK
ncbi:MAG: hypothetical protein BMS9Abin33_0249 [Gammaproteobacteria bacterium]|nr:MAG: hypothetical protein BMS9Abin33_0249 [Gammaproteobacteria bacterium]